MYCGITEVPDCFSPDNGSLYRFSWTSAFWIHNWVANMAYARYEPMIGDIRKVQTAIETSLNTRQSAIDKAAADLYATSPAEAIAFLTQYSGEAAEASTARWKELGEYLMVKFLDGNVKREENGAFKENGYGLPDSPLFPGYSKEYFEEFVRQTGDRFLETPPHF